MTFNDIRQKYLEFFKDRRHVIIPSASIVPENDPTTLFTGSGMQPMLKFLLGEKHPLGTRIVDSQKCFRSQDIEEVGDNRHTTFFEMLGNWSLGDYFKKEQIPWIFEFLTKEIGLDPQNIYVSVFRGNEKLNIPRDDESVKIWQEVFKGVGVEAKVVDFSEKNGVQGGRIFYYDEKKNWWSRAGTPEEMPIGEPGGPDSEMFWDFGAELKIHENSTHKDKPCHVNCDCGRFLEIGNNVFMEYLKTENGFSLLPQKNVDFGGGLERIVAAKNNQSDIFKTDIFSDLVAKIRELAGDIEICAVRIFADHLRAATFLVADGVRPSNKEAGYILRRLLRRILAYKVKYDIHADLFPEAIAIIKDKFGKIYPELNNVKTILEVMEEEQRKFQEAVSRGIKEIEKYENIGAAEAFYLYESFGLPFELIKELAPKENVKNLHKTDFDKEFEKHQEISRAGVGKKFGGHGLILDTGELKAGNEDEVKKTIRLHTATHLLYWAIRQFLGQDVRQMGSDINSERARFDFSASRKLTPEELKEMEKMINEKVHADLPVYFKEMPKIEAEKTGAVQNFKQKYPDIVKVYFIGPSAGSGQAPLSAEFCGGPHVEHTLEIGKVRIVKDESVSSGIRRIRIAIK